MASRYFSVLTLAMDPDHNTLSSGFELELRMHVLHKMVVVIHQADKIRTRCYF